MQKTYSLSEMQRMISLLEENLEESKKTNTILEGRVEELEEELKRLRAEKGRSDNDQQEWVNNNNNFFGKVQVLTNNKIEEERKRLEELARKLAEDQEDLDRKSRGGIFKLLKTK